jgi:hypothetical protein
MTRRDNKKGRALRIHTTNHNRRHLWDSFLSLDREVVELSMRIYNVPRRDRIALRAHRGRLHDAIKKNRLVPRAYLWAWPVYPSDGALHRTLSAAA